MDLKSRESCLHAAYKYNYKSTNQMADLKRIQILPDVAAHFHVGNSVGRQ